MNYILLDIWNFNFPVPASLLKLAVINLKPDVTYLYFLCV